ncbi:ABC transporter permease [Ketogulonicigenium vulgare]|uniref:ABC-type Fe3+ transport system permease component n=1 Tax=Ketogulonicigenium vulgare (strain WSH-001) TaxID=759362 RepID=F9Y8N3_KETVW|nr:iron ABC transporter permease [Ketogulonicigenium vulgare]ADO43022.1 iron ABC transporter permease [Ketogulonicigenium vulgare Y25]AEM41202.1 ABC-type Fe3+ transport system permease component [Ketogulonicigenium vulgare WSH-001]ALJ81343.1 iron ABC transporter permease [Ketogulonicigenium vulgare]ANW34077.1 iron ABC transporter permease [Ketogulonicigenium vulgare]AOZ54931.1 iron ABC transporter permease [Ketogulonicigenium vulgare]
MNALQKPKISAYSVVAFFCAALVVVLIAYPLVRMLWNTVLGGNLQQGLSVVMQPWFGQVFLNTAIVVGISTAFAVAIGGSLAWINQRTDAGMGAVGGLMPIIPLLIPNVAMSIGWVFIAAPRVGFLNGWLATLPDWMSFQVNIYSWAGMIFIYTINGVPYVYLIAAAAFRNMDPALEEASRINGAGIWRTFWKVSLPSVKPALVSSALLLTITSIGIYSIPAVIGTTAKIDVLTTRIVYLLNREFPPRMPEAQMIGVIILILVGVLWWVQGRWAGKGQFATVGGRATGGGKLEMGRWKWPARTLTLIYLACTSILPLAALAVVALQPFWSPRINPAIFSLNNFNQALFVNGMAVSSIRNSLFYSSIGALIAMGIAVVIAIYTAERKNLFGKGLDTAIKSSAAIPNLILGVGFLIAFAGAPFYLSGTAMILILAFVVMYISPGSIAATSAITQIGRDLREAARINGASEGRMVRRVILPLAMPGFIGGWAIVFVHMMGDLSAAALLAGITNPVVGFAILSIWEAGTFGVLAAFSMMLCLINIFVIAAMFGLGRLIAKR